MKISSACKIFINWKRSYLPKRSCDAYEVRLRMFSDYRDKNIREVNEKDIANFLIHLASLKLSGRTIAYTIQVIRMLYKFWAQKTILKLAYHDIRAPRYVPKEITYCTKDEFERMDARLNEWEFEDLKKKLALNLLWDTGMRVGELCKMTLEMIDTTKPLATIMTEKARQYGLVMWSMRTHTLLIRYLGVRICQNQRNMLFDTVVPRTVERWLLELAQRAMIGRPITPHMMRHGRAHYILNNGGTIYDVNKILRHVSIESTLKNYTIINIREFEGIASKWL